MMMAGILQTKFWRRLALNLLGLGIFTILIYWGGLDKLDQLVRPQWGYLALAALSIAFMLFIFAWRWSLLATQIAGHRLASPFDFYFYNVSSLAMGQLVSQTASVFVVRSLALTKLGDISLPNSVLSVILDKFFDLFVVVMFLSPALLLVSHILDLQQASVLGLIIAGFVSVIVFAKPRWWIIGMAGLVKIGLILTRRIPFLKRFDQLVSVNWEQIPSRTVTHTYAGIFVHSGLKKYLEFPILFSLVFLLLISNWNFARAQAIQYPAQIVGYSINVTSLPFAGQSCSASAFDLMQNSWTPDTLTSVSCIPD